MKSKKINKMVKISLLSAIAAILMFLEIPIPGIPFYKLDLSEVAVLIGAFALGPLSGVIIEFIKVFLFFIFRGTQTIFVGETANLIIGISYILPASLIYYFNKTKTKAIFGLIIGSLIMTVLGSVLNAFVLIPAYAKAFQMPIDKIIYVRDNISNLTTFILFITVPFNLLKSIITSLITLFVYKKTRKFI